VFLAAKGGHTEIVRSLLEAKATPDIKTQDGKTALNIAKEIKNKEIQSLLKKHKKPKRWLGFGSRKN